MTKNTEFLILVSSCQEGNFLIPGLRIGDSLILARLVMSEADPSGSQGLLTHYFCLLNYRPTFNKAKMSMLASFEKAHLFFQLLTMSLPVTPSVYRVQVL